MHKDCIDKFLKKITILLEIFLFLGELPSGHLKLNFDGAFDPTSGRGAVGVVARDADGGFVAEMAKSVREVQSVEHAEILAALEGVDLALTRDCISHLRRRLCCGGCSRKVSRTGLFQHWYHC